MTQSVNHPDSAPGSAPVRGLDGIADLARTAGRGLPPVHLWNPPDCGDIGLRITRDGVWLHAGAPIGRPALVRLFSTILRRDPDGYVLVTPVEKMRIEVEDAPFLAVALEVAGSPDAPLLRLRTNVDDVVEVDADHPLTFAKGPSGGLKPYVLVRGGLTALATRPVWHELVARGEVRPIAGRDMFGVESAGHFFVMAPADEIGSLE